jgi:hypothetical protein
LSVVRARAFCWRRASVERYFVRSPFSRRKPGAANMTTWMQLTLVMIVLGAQVPALRRQWLEDRQGAIKTFRLLIYYLIYVGVGIAILTATLPEGRGTDIQALAGIGFILGWILLGGSWLIKVVPKYRTVPAWLLKPVGIPDVIGLAMVVVSLFALFR